jgi:hypothetical protein
VARSYPLLDALAEGGRTNAGRPDRQPPRMKRCCGYPLYPWAAAAVAPASAQHEQHDEDHDDGGGAHGNSLSFGEDVGLPVRDWRK